MALGANRARWWHTATLQATVINLLRPKGKKPISPAELHPCLEKKPPIRVSGKGLIILKYAFCQEQIKREQEEAARLKQ